MKNLVKMLTKRTINKGQMLYREGELADKIFLVLQGKFKIMKKVYIMDRGKDEKLVVDNTGQLVKSKFGKAL